MNCFAKDEKRIDLLLDYCASTLDQARTAEVDRHLELCPECRRVVNAQRAVFSSLDSCTAPEVSADFDARLHARIAADKLSFVKRWLPVAPVQWWKPAIPIGMAVAVLSVMFFTHSFSSKPKPAGFQKADLEQVEQALDDIDMLQPSAM